MGRGSLRFVVPKKMGECWTFTVLQDLPLLMLSIGGQISSAVGTGRLPCTTFKKRRCKWAPAHLSPVGVRQSLSAGPVHCCFPKGTLAAATVERARTLLHCSRVFGCFDVRLLSCRTVIWGIPISSGVRMRNIHASRWLTASLVFGEVPLGGITQGYLPARSHRKGRKGT